MGYVPRFLRRVSVSSDPQPRPSRESPVTVVLTNWKRPGNMRRLLEALDAQTVRPVIYLWNNGEAFDDPRIDWRVDSDRNMACLPRWFLASLTGSEFTGVMDDDLLPADGRVFEDLLGALRASPPKTVTGAFGIRLDPAKEYLHGLHMTSQPDGDLPTDVVKGRFAFTRAADLAHVPLQPSVRRDTLICDDIIVCGALAGGRPGRHLLPAALAGRLSELPCDHALCKQPDHFVHRESARRRCFSC